MDVSIHHATEPIVAKAESYDSFVTLDFVAGGNRVMLFLPKYKEEQVKHLAELFNQMLAGTSE